MNIDLRTTVEKARAARHAQICDMYKNLAEQAPGCAPGRLFDAIAREFSMSLMGIRAIIIRYGLYRPKN